MNFRSKGFQTRLNDHFDLKFILTYNLYTLNELGALSNLIGSLSRVNRHCPPPTEWIMH